MVWDPKQVRAWSLDQVRHFAQELKREHKGVWDSPFMTLRIREALAVERIFYIVSGQDRITVDVAAMRQLRNDFFEALGLRDKDAK